MRADKVCIWVYIVGAGLPAYRGYFLCISIAHVSSPSPGPVETKQLTSSNMMSKRLGSVVWSTSFAAYYGIQGA